MDIEYIQNREIVLYKIGKFQRDVELFFPDLRVVAYIDDNPENQFDVLNGKRVLRGQTDREFLNGKLVIVCSFEEIGHEDFFRALGLAYGRDFIWGNDLIESIDSIDKKKDPINEAFLAQKRIIVFGAGGTAERFNMQYHNIDVEFYVDNDDKKWGLKYNGKPIRNPDILLSLNISEYLIIVAIGMSAIFDAQLQLEKMGFRHGTDFVYFVPDNGRRTKMSALLRKTIEDEPITDLVCTRPFNSFVTIGYNGEVDLCCRSFLDLSPGSLLTSDMRDINNSVCARLIRLSILNGTYSYCNKSLCLRLHDPVKERDPDFRRMEDFPDVNFSIDIDEKYLLVNLGHDSACNLSCPSCRNDRSVNWIKDDRRTKFMHDKILRDIIPHTRLLSVASNGDPFFSDYYREIIFDKFTGPGIRIQTNGMLFNKSNWLKLKDKYQSIKVFISVDAATDATYGKIRGGSYQQLMRNMEFASELRKKEEIAFFSISFVIQRGNFTEMPDFVEMGILLGADYIVFQRFLNMGHLTDEEHLAQDVVDERNPHHDEFLEILGNPLFKSDKVVLGF